LGDYDDESQELKNDLEILKGNRTNYGVYQTIGNLVLSSGLTPVNIAGNCQPINQSQNLEKLFDGDDSTKWYAGAGSTEHVDISAYHIYWAYGRPLTFSLYFVIIL
jgi:hypothetical protein